MSETIHQEVVLPAPPADVYAALTETERFQERTGGAPTSIDAREGGAFSCFGGMILGRNIECVPGERLVQAWRVKLWEPGDYSLVRFDLSPAEGGTRVVLTHSSYPEGQTEQLASGWHDNYWEPLRLQLA